MDNLQPQRLYVANLLRKVLVGELHVKDALLKYPKDVQDESLMACYHALIHFEADEDLRHRDRLYLEEQNEYMEFLANTLEKGEDIPINIINNYKKLYSSAPILHETSKNGLIKRFLRFLNIK